MFVKLLRTNIIIIIALVTPLTMLPLFVQAQDDVHFGTIFVEEVQYENSDENNFVNSLTDSSQKQLELENLYKDIGNENQRLKKMKLDTRSPASAEQLKKVKDGERIGVVRNSELPQKIIYFLELRSFRGNQPSKVYEQASQTGAHVYTLHPGEIVKIIDTPPQYLHKLRMDRDNQGIWKNISNREEDNQNMHVYYDWRNYHTLTPADMPVEMEIVVPRGRNSIPVFNSPGSWTWKDCGLNEGLCLDQLDQDTKTYLFDTTFITMSRIRAQSSHQLFYKIGYQVKTKEGKTEHKVGWVSSEFAKRKISQLPKSLLATRNPNGLGTYESDAERLQRLKKYYVFDENMNSSNKNLNRWLASAPGRSTEVFYQNIAIDGIASANLFHLEQSFLSEDFDQYGIAVGAGIYAPIFIDLEIQGTATVNVPVSTKSDVYEEAFIFRGENWLLYTTPISISGLPLKLGVGGYYITMFASEKDFGFNSLVGFQGKAMVENENFWLGTRWGPTGQDLNFSFENRELGLDIGIRLNPAKNMKAGLFSLTTLTPTSLIRPHKTEQLFS